MLWILIFLTSGLFLLYFLVSDRPPLKIVFRTLARDIKALRLYFKVYSFVKKCYFQNLSVVDLFKKTVEKTPDAVCFIFEDEEWTYKQIDDLSNKIAYCFKQRGYEKGDVVALFMENCPDYICFWLGLSKIGVITALINTNQKADSLAHSINISDIKGVIFGQSLAENLEKALPYLDKKDTADFYCYTRKSEAKQNEIFSYKSLNASLDEVLNIPAHFLNLKINYQDKLMYIFTSGTTGFPKAAIISHSRFLYIVTAAQYVTQLDGPQIFYNPLPMYHSAGGILFLGVVMLFGGKMIIRKKFSASNYWKEVVKHKVTVCQYIGEICRYLLNQPKVPEETQHSVSVMFGNGLRANIWKEFQERFKIERIVEMYGATEGNANLVNMFGKVGAVGFISLNIATVYPVRLIKVNPETGEILRNKNGFCIPCKPGEPGEIIGNVRESNPANRFDGYVNPNDTKKKIVRNVFKKGDMAFLSGDILVMDEEGYIYFKDRSGDTFRWKGENISTTEVETIISKSLSLAACIVYGVEIPGADGRAGMATIQADMKSTDLEMLLKDMNERLPSYAIPIFIRQCTNIESTGTHKLRKVNFQKEGYNPDQISDPLYFLDMKKKKYIPLTEEIYSDILNGRIRM